jgi:UDP:flavonoid glycosyltransferase YjiC (YdhE family)
MRASRVDREGRCVKGDAMRVTMLTLGSRGDVQPLIAFALGLERSGHRTRIATYPRLGPLVTDQGVDFAELAEGALSQGTQTEEGRRWIEKGHRRLPTWVGFIRDARSVADRRLADAVAACEDADVIVANNLAQVLGWQVSAHLGVPLVRVLFHAPGYWMTRGSSSSAGRAVRQLAWLAARPWLNSVRRRAVGWPKVGLREPFTELDRQKLPVLYPASPAVYPMPPGADGAAAVTGYWFLDASLDPEPPSGLVEFLDAGPPPVYVGFGSQIDTDPRETTDVMVQALRRAGHRGILLRPPEAIGSASLGDDIFAISAVSHAWLFRRCSAVVHHSAAGTTAAGLRAGVPTVPVPDNTDQFSWARRIHELGVASAPIRRRKLSPAQLGEAIRLVTTDEAIRARSAALGETIRAEDGVGRAVAHFERSVASAVASGGSAPAVAGSERGQAVRS